MSWISDLAGKAENILNKIDQNAANVLQQPIRTDVEEGLIITSEGKSEQSVVEGIKRNISSTSLSLTKSLTPKKIHKNDVINSISHDDQSSIRPERPSSNLSSRRSSMSSRADGSIIEQETAIEISNTRKQEVKVSDMNLEKELAAAKIILAQVTCERNDLQNELSNIQDRLRELNNDKKILEMEGLVRTLSSERDNLKDELHKLKKISSDYVKSVSELETNLAKANQSVIHLTDKLEWQKKEAEQSCVELDLYRKKAQATLQMKEKLIEELKLNKSEVNETSEFASSKALEYEIEALKQENVNLGEELRSAIFQLDTSKEFIQKLERQIEERNMDTLKNEDASKLAIKTEQQRSSQLEAEIKIMNQELAAVREEMNRQRQTFLAKLNEKEKEIQKCKTNCLENTGLSDVNNLEDRMQFLTQALVQKQASIETVTAERNALRLQLEKTEDQLRHMIVQHRQQRVQIINVNDTDDAKLQLPLLLRETPFDTNVARKVKRAYSSLDSAGIRVGVFLRRYPLIRIFVIVYIALLHLWVMFVLLSSSPT